MNDNVTGTIDRTYPACESEFVLSGSAARVFPLNVTRHEPRAGEDAGESAVA